MAIGRVAGSPTYSIPDGKFERTLRNEKAGPIGEDVRIIAAESTSQSTASSLSGTDSNFCRNPGVSAKKPLQKSFLVPLISEYMIETPVNWILENKLAGSLRMVTFNSTERLNFERSCYAI